MCAAEDQLDEVETENTALIKENSELQDKVEGLEEQIRETQEIEEDVDMLCSRLGITRREWDLERGHICNQLLK